MTSQKEFLTSLCANNPQAVIVGSIGTISYDLTDVPHDNKILLRGAMGSAISFGLGYALSSLKEVIVIVGDGAFLMSMGAVATVLKHKPKNLKIYILNNGTYKSCGGQATNYPYIEEYLPTETFSSQSVS